MKRDVIIACDFATPEATLEFLDKFKDEKPFIKIGMELSMPVVQKLSVSFANVAIRYFSI